MKNLLLLLILLLISYSIIINNNSYAIENSSKGQTLYIPVYSEIPYGDQAHTIPLTATLSIRNTDELNPINITKVNYYDSNGKLLRSHLANIKSLQTLSALEYVVNESDRKGGISASFVVEWNCPTTSCSIPVVEAVMISTRSAQGISMTSVARVTKELSEKSE